uniref:Uncharacterized protein n=1 Tax=Noctiluca scintillans TaxID=2966 RepID=A0A7S1A340_NOCSC|mmetsp:Transcript_29623/g.78474  ORF Transcript_29623/g.78474 Transcript_29623/m.78474 type:complete len:104 (+) Transcript_29623:51-362(+)
MVLYYYIAVASVVCCHGFQASPQKLRHPVATLNSAPEAHLASVEEKVPSQLAGTKIESGTYFIRSTPMHMVLTELMLNNPVIRMINNVFFLPVNPVRRGRTGK